MSALAIGRSRAGRRGLLDFVGAALCLWAAGYHTPIGALLRDFAARVFSSKANTLPLLAYYTGGVYDAQTITAPELLTPVPDVEVLTAVPPGRAVGRGVFAAAATLGPKDRAVVDALAAHYGLPFSTPDDAATLIERASVDLGSEEAAVLAVFAGYDVASYAAHRSGAEGKTMTLEALAARLPPGSQGAIGSASTALMLGTAYGLGWPVAPGTRVTSPFGFRHHPTLGRGQFHTGVDLAVPEGTPVKVTAAGIVRRASEDGVNGRVVIVDHGRGVSTAYCHNSVLRVSVGQRVVVGEVIAESGTTGRSTGPHVHYQLELGHHPMDPFSFRGSRPVLIAPSTAPLKKAFEQFRAPPESEE